MNRGSRSGHQFDGLDPASLLRTTPIFLPQLLALIALVTFSAAEGGYPLEDWAPAAVIVELLLLVAVFTLPRRGDTGPERVAATIAIVGLAVWTAMSIGWADDRGAAAIATTRTALLAATFVLFARWRHRPPSALTAITALTAGLGLLTWATVIRLWNAESLEPWFFWERLLEPVGYVNAGAAFWGITALLATGLLGGSIHPAQRLLGAGVAVPAAALSFLCLSRGGVLSVAIVVVLTLLLLPGRVRNAGAYAVTGAGLLIALPSLWDVGGVVHTPQGPATLHTALLMTVVGTFAALALTGAWVLAERGAGPGTEGARQARRIGGGVLAAVAVAALLAFATGTGPVTTAHVGDAIDSITDGYEPAAPGESRLTTGLGSGRWEFWEVAWDQFQDAPLIGQGADNYRQDHLQFGTSPENPRFPHQLGLRQLGQLGIVGGLLMVVWIGAVLTAARRLASAADPAARALAVSASGAVALWVVHGSADWLLEFGGLTAIVAACAGLLVAASPARASTRPAAPGRPAGSRHATTFHAANTLGAALLIVAAVWTAAQWVSDRDRLAALALSGDQPQRAVERAERARALDPFSERPDLILGALALNRRDLRAAHAAYADAHRRNARATSPMLWLGVIAAAEGNREVAAGWLDAAATASPRDGLIGALRADIDAGHDIDPFEVRRGLAERTANLVREGPAGP